MKTICRVFPSTHPLPWGLPLLPSFPHPVVVYSIYTIQGPISLQPHPQLKAPTPVSSVQAGSEAVHRYQPRTSKGNTGNSRRVTNTSLTNKWEPIRQSTAVQLSPIMLRQSRWMQALYPYLIAPKECQGVSMSSCFARQLRRSVTPQQIMSKVIRFESAFHSYHN